jgi:outer membrane lipoprotein-sorting protein
LLHVARARIALPLLLLLGSLRLGVAAVDEDASHSGVDSADVTSLDDLMQRLGHSGGVEARFRETRYVSLLTEPFESEGVLYFSPPDLLARHITRPGRSSVVVRGTRVALRDETGFQELSASSSEVVPALIDHLVGLLRGDLETLQSRHTIVFRPGRDWELRLEPKSRLVRSIIASIRIEGRGGQLSSIETVETSGDRTITVFSDVQTNRSFSPAESERFFSIEDRSSTP